MPRVIHIPSRTLIKRQFETSGLLQSTLERISTSYLITGLLGRHFRLLK